MSEHPPTDEKNQSRSAPRRPWRVFVVMFLVLATLQVPVLIELVTPIPWSGKPTMQRVGGTTPEWPATTPHEQPWPAVTQINIERGVARRRTTTWSSTSMQGIVQTTHRMQHDVYGWPLPMLYHTRRWWPSSPSWASDAPWDTGLRVNWVGSVLNPLMGVAIAATIWFLPAWIVRAIRSYRRRRRGCCAKCGYPIGVSALCTECGNTLPH
jgi:hypothetical protein